jgi:hypothetical protein
MIYITEEKGMDLIDKALEYVENNTKPLPKYNIHQLKLLISTYGEYMYDEGFIKGDKSSKNN